MKRKLTVSLLLSTTLFACSADNGGGGPADWAKAAPAQKLEGAAAGTQFTISVPANFVGRADGDAYSIDYRVGDRVYAPSIFIQEWSTKRTLEKATKYEKKVLDKGETEQGFYYVQDNGDTPEEADFIVYVGKHVGEKTLTCQARVFRQAKSESVEAVKAKLPAARAICESIAAK